MTLLTNRLAFIALSLGLFFSVKADAVWQQPPYQFPATGFSMDIASDADGNAIVVLDDAVTTGNVLAFYYSRVTNTWSVPTILAADGRGVALGMDPSGTALATWITGNDIHSAFFNGSTWVPGSPDPLATTGGVNNSSLNMNGPNIGLLVWLDNTANTANSAFFNAGAWGSVVPVAPADGTQLDSDCSSNGTAVAIFQLGTALQVSNFIGGTWQAPVTLDPVVPLTNRNGVVEINSSGIAVAVWVNTAGDVQASTFNGTLWLPAVTISNTAGNDPFTTSLSMSPSGTAVATWVDGLGVGRSNSFNGTAWAIPQQFSPTAQGSAVSVNASGEALVLFQMADDNLYSSRLPLGGTWSPPEFVFTPADTMNIIDPSLSDNGFGFAGYGFGVEGNFYFASVEIVALPPDPPETIEGSVCKNNFAAQTDRINVITFTPSLTPTVAFYNLTRNGTLIGIIPAEGPYIFLDHGRCKKIADTYTVTAVDINGLVSTPITVTIN